MSDRPFTSRCKMRRGGCHQQPWLPGSTNRCSRPCGLPNGQEGACDCTRHPVTPRESTAHQSDRHASQNTGNLRGGPFCDFWVVEWQDLRWFFFCMRCRRRDPDKRRGWYVNSDGWVSTDSEDSDDQPSAVGENFGSRYMVSPEPKRRKIQ